jgi:hypothetical protein
MSRNASSGRRVGEDGMSQYTIGQEGVSRPRRRRRERKKRYA